MATNVKGESVPVKKTPPTETRKPTESLTHFDDFGRFLDAVFPWAGMRPFHFEWPRFPELAPAFEGRRPKVDLVERDDSILLKAELPGVEKKDIEIDLTETSLVLRAETRRETKEEKGDFHHCEIARGSFTRSLLLPQPIDVEKAQASFKDGMLEVVMPKAKTADKRRVAVD